MCNINFSFLRTTLHSLNKTQTPHIWSATSNYYYRQELGTVDRLLLQGHSRRPNENEDNTRVNSCPQSTASESLAVKMTQQIGMRAIGNTPEMALWSLWRPTSMPINYNTPPKMTNSTSTDISYGGAWCNRVVAKQEDSHSTAPAVKQINE